MTVKGIMHRGSGLGNQLHRYVGTKIIAMEKGEQHTMIAPELFKGKDFLKLDIEPNDIKYTIKEPSGEVVPESYEGVLDGEFQNEKDFYPHIDKVREWIKPNYRWEEDCCVISHRGGEYKGVSELYLPQEYWDLAIKMMLEINQDMKFRVVTDDVEEADRMFPDFPVTHEMENDWCSILSAKYLILSNSSFAILPAYMNEHVEKIIAPKYWARYNTHEWLNQDNSTYSKFTYVHHED